MVFPFLYLFAKARAHDEPQTVTKNKLCVSEYAQRQATHVLHYSAGELSYSLCNEAQMANKTVRTG